MGPFVRCSKKEEHLRLDDQILNLYPTMPTFCVGLEIRDIGISNYEGKQLENYENSKQLFLFSLLELSKLFKVNGG